MYELNHCRVAFRIPDTIKEIITKYSELLNISNSEFMRLAINNEIKRTKKRLNSITK